ncbi:VanZ family protein [Corynebacterium sp. P7202]|uniref:VanZ family protein n=1 Tax=Corynebacterium pygosceleis TaxID=2800406 RepID=A0A9Q4CAD6_9CORY|nr:VanZ family protein [Corynebacterium pygosceleis]MCK7637832.1 VanZ family protein [Corynebacterium pygosceleis]MCX7444628.1 VanZ family protein [Corynebacterium pygosceleis]MCX7468548.1 VanZ family protein [Corynebacterium pygosceleis]
MVTVHRKTAFGALFVYTGVMLALTMFKAFFVIGHLWRPENQRTRSLELVPLAEAFRGSSWFAPLFDGIGNVAFFVPFGVLLYIILGSGSNPLRRVTLVGAAVSLGIEMLQYVFALGHSDVTDILFNTLGAFLGAGFARLCGPRFHRWWVGLSFLLGAVFLVLVGLGDRLGDPEKIVELR